MERCDVERRRFGRPSERLAAQQASRETKPNHLFVTFLVIPARANPSPQTAPRHPLPLRHAPSALPSQTPNSCPTTVHPPRYSTSPPPPPHPPLRLQTPSSLLTPTAPLLPPTIRNSPLVLLSTLLHCRHSSPLQFLALRQLCRNERSSGRTDNALHSNSGWDNEYDSVVKSKPSRFPPRIDPTSMRTASLTPLHPIRPTNKSRFDYPNPPNTLLDFIAHSTPFLSRHPRRHRPLHRQHATPTPLLPLSHSSYAFSVKTE